MFQWKTVQSYIVNPSEVNISTYTSSSHIEKTDLFLPIVIECIFLDFDRRSFNQDSHYSECCTYVYAVSPAYSLLSLMRIYTIYPIIISLFGTIFI